MKRKIIFISLIFLVLLSLNNIVNASNPDYEIIGYDINIEVNDSNVFNITETIKANFLEDSHGIIREIPINNKIKREDGTISKNYADITNIEINEQYTKKKKDGNIILKIGNSDEIVSGEKEYIIKYSYDLGKDTGITYDELYFNLIGSRWNTTIENITFTIKMPKEFDKTKLGFTSGKEGSKDSTGVTYSVDGNIIKGSLDKKLKNSAISIYKNSNKIFLYPNYKLIKERYYDLVSRDYKKYLSLCEKYNYPVSLELNLYIKPKKLVDKICDFEKLYLNSQDEYIKEEAGKILYNDLRKLLFTPSIYATQTQEMKKEFKDAYNYFISSKKNSALRPLIMSYMDKKRGYNENNFKSDYPYKTYELVKIEKELI